VLPTLQEYSQPASSSAVTIVAPIAKSRFG
jgi:hypothetical protein